jgi:hypothetical protein
VRSSARGDLIGAFVVSSFVLGFCFLLLWHDPQLFWNDDYEISILPVFADVARSWSEGHLPLLSPYSWICSNLAGEFQYGTFSIFVNAAVVLIWKFPLTFPEQAAALSMAHLFVLAFGGYLLARGRNLSAPLSMMVALIAALNGWIICWGATDWFGALGAFAWLPWAWWGLERALNPRCGRWRFLWPAPSVYLLVSGGFPYTVLMLGLLVAWLGLKSLGRTGKISSIFPLVFGSLLGLGLSAPAWLALLDYVHGSAREAQPASAHFQWLVPLAALPGFVLPCWTVNWANFSTQLLPHAATELACGLAAPVALLVGLVTRGRLLVRQIKWELGLLVVVLVISMLPSANVFRWSFRWLPFVELILGLCAAEALQMLDLGSGASPLARRILSSAGFWAMVIVALTASAMWMAHTGGRYAWPLSAVMFTLAACWAVIDLLAIRFRGLQSWAPPAVTFAALLATYLCFPPNSGVPKFNLAQELLSSAPLDPGHLYLSVYPPPEIAYRMEKKPGPVGQVVRPGSTSMWGGIHLINGYSPIRAAGVAHEFGSSIHGEIDPGVADYLLGWQAGPNGELAKLGVDGIIVASELQFAPKPDAEWNLAYSSDEGRVYHRRGASYAPVRAVISLASRPNEQFAVAYVTLIENSRNRVIADVAVSPGDRPALITFSRPYFRGYEAQIGTHRLNVSSYRGLLPVVEVPPGISGRLVLVYRPWWLVWGGVATAISALLMFSPALLTRFQGRGA